MSLQWTILATFLYVEIGLCILLMIPYIPAARWQRIFRSRLLNAFHSYANVYFMILMAMLVLLFTVGAYDVRRLAKQLGDADDLLNPAVEAHLQSKLFRSQRNFYISGFAIFLFVVLRRLVTLISNEAALKANCEATRRQAESASVAAMRLMEESDNTTNEGGEQKTSPVQLKELTDEVEKLKQELNHSAKDVDAMKRQTQSTNKEYDRLLQEHAQLQSVMARLKGDGAVGAKKDD